MSMGTGKSRLDGPSSGFNTAGQGFFFGSGIFPANQGNTAQPLVQTNNEVRCIQFVLHESWTLRHATYAPAVAGAAGATISCAIYSADGTTKLVEALFDGTNILPQSIAINVILPAGTYFFAWSASTTVTMTGQCVTNLGVQTANQIWKFFNNVTVKFGSSPNVCVAGIMPTSLGTIFANYISTPANDVPVVVFEP